VVDLPWITNAASIGFDKFVQTILKSTHRRLDPTKSKRSNPLCDELTWNIMNVRGASHDRLLGSRCRPRRFKRLSMKKGPKDKKWNDAFACRECRRCSICGIKHDVENNRVVVGVGVMPVREPAPRGEVEFDVPDECDGADSDACAREVGATVIVLCTGRDDRDRASVYCPEPVWKKIL
jgi:hypothetical protein